MAGKVAAEADVMCNRPFSNAKKADHTRLNLPVGPLIQNTTHLWWVSVGCLLEARRAMSV
jgi:hypothetical protein